MDERWIMFLLLIAILLLFKCGSYETFENDAIEDLNEWFSNNINTYKCYLLKLR